MCATLTRDSPFFTRPTYSSMSLGLLPAAVTRIGAAMCTGMRLTPGVGEGSVGERPDGLRAPDAVEAAVAAAAGAVGAVALRVPLREILVVVLGGPEDLRRPDLGGDAALEPARARQRRPRFERDAPLLLVPVEDRAP